MRARLLVAVLVAVVAAAGAMALGGGRALASHVSCGDTITADTTLDTDLVNCPNHGIVIGADDVTLDLNGHLVDGDGTPAADCDNQKEPCDFGLFNDGRDGVTVMHGSVREFAVGVLFGTATGRARHNRVLGVSATRNQFAGIGIFSQVRSLVRNSSGNGSLDREGIGLGLGDSQHVRILNNSFRHNPHNGINTGQSSRNLIRGNVFSRNGDEGILVEGAARYRMTRNRFVRNGGGITLGPSNRSLVANNRIVGGSDGIRVEKGHDNLVAANLVVGTRHVGITLGIHDPFIGGADNVVRGNVVRRSGVDGIVVVEKDRHSELIGNVVTRSADDGFDVDSSTTTLTANRAGRNGDLGIEAVFGVTDGGGNKAFGNGNPLQCTNITCNGNPLECTNITRVVASTALCSSQAVMPRWHLGRDLSGL
jgi:parallel beta-helix repeat protein